MRYRDHMGIYSDADYIHLSRLNICNPNFYRGLKLHVKIIQSHCSGRINVIYIYVVYCRKVIDFRRNKFVNFKLRGDNIYCGNLVICISKYTGDRNFFNRLFCNKSCGDRCNLPIFARIDKLSGFSKSPRHKRASARSKR